MESKQVKAPKTEETVVETEEVPKTRKVTKKPKAEKKPKETGVVTEEIDTEAMLNIISESTVENEPTFAFNTSADLTQLFEKVANNPSISKTLKSFYNRFKEMRKADHVEFKKVELFTKEIVNYCKIVASVIVNANYEDSNKGDVFNIQQVLRSAFFKNHGFIAKHTKCNAKFDKSSKYCDIELELDFSFDKFDVYKIDEKIGLGNISQSFPNILGKIHDKYYSYILLLAIILSLEGVHCLKLKEKKVTKKEKEDASKPKEEVVKEEEEYKDLIDQLIEKFAAACTDNANSTLNDFINFVRKEKAKPAGGAKTPAKPRAKTPALNPENYSVINNASVVEEGEDEVLATLKRPEDPEIDELNTNSASVL